MPVKIHGKSYSQVHERINMVHGTDVSLGCSVNTYIEWLTEPDGNGLREVLIKATVLFTLDGKDFVFHGHAHEREEKKGVNATSFIENAETSAVGRALAFAGFGGESIASADEVNNAIDTEKRNGNQKQAPPSPKPEPKQPEAPKPAEPSGRATLEGKARTQARAEAGEAYKLVKDKLDEMGLTSEVFMGCVYHHFQVSDAEEMTLANYRNLKNDLTDGFAAWLFAAAKSIGGDVEDEPVELAEGLKDQEPHPSNTLDERKEERHSTTLDSPNN